MITKAEILELAAKDDFLPTTVQKDYVIGWILRSVSHHPYLSKWVFKGGTCLKKCYIETYRFSEDLDFTIPSNQSINTKLIKKYLEEAISWIEENCGLTFPRQDWKIEEYKNPRGNTSFQAKVSCNGPIGGAIKSLPRVKFDITQDELLIDKPDLRDLHHSFSDKFNPTPQILCYSINEILAEKSRALFERNGRARDVYDVVNMSRNFRKEIDSERTKDIANAKFKFKKLPIPTVKLIMDAIDENMLRANWEQQLAHQVSRLPTIETFFDDLKDALAWWLQPKLAKPKLKPMPQAKGRVVPRIFFPSTHRRTGSSMAMEQIRRAAHNRQCVLISCHGHTRLVEPYSLRYPPTGNEILHVHEIEKGGILIDEHRKYKTHEIEFASISDKTFVPRWEVEL